MKKWQKNEWECPRFNYSPSDERVFETGKTTCEGKTRLLAPKKEKKSEYLSSLETVVPTMSTTHYCCMLLPLLGRLPLLLIVSS